MGLADGEAWEKEYGTQEKLKSHTIIDRNVVALSKVQVQLMDSKMTTEDFNKASEMIGELKEFLINCDSYNCMQR